MFAFVAQQLAGRVQHIEAGVAHAMDVIADARETTALVRTLFGFEELFEAVPSQLLVLDVVRLVLF